MAQCSEVIYSTLNREYVSSQKTTILYSFTYLHNNPKANYKVSMNRDKQNTHKQKTEQSNMYNSDNIHSVSTATPAMMQ